MAYQQPQIVNCPRCGQKIQYWGSSVDLMCRRCGLWVGYALAAKPKGAPLDEAERGCVGIIVAVVIIAFLIAVLLAGLGGS
ncbi:hypothetical protein ACFY04_22000 [Streptomyces sp. NPDC001549]|uniref:hypothetical protein n=1 Tax=Streptomyces sp. NPDC001549 TaxID=3364586 RepID=UPI0036B0BE9D